MPGNGHADDVGWVAEGTDDPSYRAVSVETSTGPWCQAYDPRPPAGWTGIWSKCPLDR
jgi:hypothetical protein